MLLEHLGLGQGPLVVVEVAEEQWVLPMGPLGLLAQLEQTGMELTPVP